MAWRRSLPCPALPRQAFTCCVPSAWLSHTTSKHAPQPVMARRCAKRLLLLTAATLVPGQPSLPPAAANPQLPSSGADSFCRRRAGVAHGGRARSKVMRQRRSRVTHS